MCVEWPTSAQVEAEHAYSWQILKQDMLQLESESFNAARQTLSQSAVTFVQKKAKGLPDRSMSLFSNRLCGGLGAAWLGKT